MSSSLVLLSTMAAAAAGVPKANLTVYHVNPLSFGGIPFNMDTGDATGDLYVVVLGTCTARA